MALSAVFFFLLWCQQFVNQVEERVLIVWKGKGERGEERERGEGEEEREGL